jgi:hypothetical protein
VQDGLEDGRDVVARDVLAKRLRVDPHAAGARVVGQRAGPDDRPLAV